MNDVLQAFVHLVPRAVDADMIDAPAWRAQLIRQIEFFPAVALPTPAAATVICGLVHANGVGELWMVTGQGFEKTARTVLQQQRQLARTFYAALRLHRLHLLVDSARDDARRWAQLLGFSFEARLSKFGHVGQDRDMFIFNQTKGETSWQH